MNEKIIRCVGAVWQAPCAIRGNYLVRLDIDGEKGVIAEWDGDVPKAIWWPSYGSVEKLAYNKATDEYFITLYDGRFPTNCRTSCALAPDFTVHERSKTCMYLIAKNACSTMMGTILAEHGFAPNNGSPTQVWAPRTRHYCHGIADYDPERWQDYTHIAVYHDPVDRFVNLVNYCYKINPGLLAPYTDKCKTKEELIETILHLAYLNHFNRPGPFEQHLAPQTWFYNNLPRLDVVVRMPDLSRYMREVMHVEPYNCNVDERHDITRDDMTEAYIEELFRVAWPGEDKLEEKLAGKFWEAPTPTDSEV